MSYKTILFDLDGTLLDTLRDLYSSINRALKANGLPERSLGCGLQVSPAQLTSVYYFCSYKVFYPNLFIYLFFKVLLFAFFLSGIIM